MFRVLARVRVMMKRVFLFIDSILVPSGRLEVRKIYASSDTCMGLHKNALVESSMMMMARWRAALMQRWKVRKQTMKN